MGGKGKKGDYTKRERRKKGVCKERNRRVREGRKEERGKGRQGDYIRRENEKEGRLYEN